LATAGHHMGI